MPMSHHTYNRFVHTHSQRPPARGARGVYGCFERLYWWAVVILLALLTIPFSSAQASEPRSDLAAQMRLGVEYDNNVHRTERHLAEHDFLTRYFATFDFMRWHNSNSYSTLILQQGGKVFGEQRGADHILTQIELGHRLRLNHSLILSVDADIKDSTERVSLRDYHRGGARAGAHIITGPLRSSATLGWRYFTYKPHQTSNHHGPQLQLSTRLPLTYSIQVDLGYTLTWRLFDTPILFVNDEQIVQVGDRDALRRDFFHAARLGVSYRGSFILDAGYILSLNHSNSYGQRLLRHTFRTTMTVPFIYSTFISLHAELQRTTYSDAFLIDGVFIVDEENRNNITASLARPLFENWEVEMRYSLYLQEFGVGDHYQRQTFMIAMAYIF